MTPEAKALLKIMRRMEAHFPNGITLSTLMTMLALPGDFQQVLVRVGSRSTTTVRKSLANLRTLGWVRTEGPHKHKIYHGTARTQAVLDCIKPTTTNQQP